MKHRGASFSAFFFLKNFNSGPQARITPISPPFGVVFAYHSADCPINRQLRAQQPA